MLTVRYFAAARSAAGTSAESVEALCVDDAIIALQTRHGERFAAVLSSSSLLLDGVHVSDGSQALAADAELDVLPPFAGG